MHNTADDSFHVQVAKIVPDYVKFVRPSEPFLPLQLRRDPLMCASRKQTFTDADAVHAGGRGYGG